MATWFDDGDPADQPVEDLPVVIHVPLLRRGGSESNTLRGGRDAERGGLLGPRHYNRPAVLPVAPDVSAGDVPADFLDGERGRVGEVVHDAAADDSPGGGEHNLHFGGRYLERGGLLGPRHYNRPVVRPVLPDVDADDVPAPLSVAARGGVGAVLAEDDLGGGRKNQEFPTVVVKWDKCDDIKGWERGGVGDQVLKDHLYNKDKKNAWRLDVDADCFKEVGSAVGPEGADDDLQGKSSDSDDEDSCENDSSSEEDTDDVDEEDDGEEEEDSEDEDEY